MKLNGIEMIDHDFCTSHLPHIYIGDVRDKLNGNDVVQVCEVLVW